MCISPERNDLLTNGSHQESPNFACNSVSAETSHTPTLHGHETNSGSRNNKAQPLPSHQALDPSQGARLRRLADWANMSLTSICTTTATPNHNRVHVQNCEAQTQKIRYSWSTLQKKPLSWAEQAERICCVPEVLRQIYWISGLSGNQTSAWKNLLQMKQSGCVLLDAYLLFC